MITWALKYSSPFEIGPDYYIFPESQVPTFEDMKKQIKKIIRLNNLEQKYVEMVIIRNS